MMVVGKKKLWGKSKEVEVPVQLITYQLITYHIMFFLQSKVKITNQHICQPNKGLKFRKKRMGWWNRRFRDVRQCLMDPSRNGRQDCRFHLNGFAGEKLQVLPYIVGHKIPGFRVHLLALNTLLDISCPLRISQTKIQPGPYNVDILEGG